MTIFLLYIALGLLVGLLSGLFGVGGGIIIVPALFWMFQRLHFPVDTLMHVAVSTSLSCMVVTAFGSTWAHYQRGNVQWNVWRQCLLGGIIGAPLGVLLAQCLSTLRLKQFFGFFLMMVAIDMFYEKSLKKRLMPHSIGYTVLGFSVGLLSGCLGVGGGVIMVPVLIKMGYTFVQASGTAIATIFVTSTIGTLSAIQSGWGLPELPVDTFGYVYWPATIGIGFSGLFSSKWGTMLANKWNQRRLKRLFAGLAFCMAVKMFV